MKFFSLNENWVALAYVFTGPPADDLDWPYLACYTQFCSSVKHFIARTLFHTYSTTYTLKLKITLQILLRYQINS